MSQHANVEQMVNNQGSSASVDLDWLEDPARLLEKLESADTTPEARHQAVLYAEIADFTENQRVRMLNALFTFIAENRFTTDEDTITVTGSAIRKYAMNMEEARFNAYTEWLQPSTTQRVHHQVELELVKGACWRLQYVPVAGTPDIAQFRNNLRDVALDYLQPRLILDKNYAAIALCAIVAVVLLDRITGEREASEELLHRTTAMKLDWFAELVSHGLDDAMKDARRFNPQIADEVASLVATADATRDAL